MKNRLLALLTIFLIGIGGCSSDQAEVLTKDEQEAIYREEVQKMLKEEKMIEDSKEEEEEDSEETEMEEGEVEAAETLSKGEKFLTLPLGTQASIISTYLDERASADSLVDGGFYTGYSFENNYTIIQVTSGAGSGHPIYLVELQNETYIPTDAVVFVGSDSVEKRTPPQVEITLSELYDEYLSNEYLYDLTNDTAYDIEMTVADFNRLRDSAKVIDEVVGTVDGVTNTINDFMSFDGSVGIGFTIYNGSSTTVEYSPHDIKLYKDGELLTINGSGDSGILAPGETGSSYLYVDFRGFEPYQLEWKSLEITITPSMS